MRVRALGLAGLLAFVVSVALQAQGGRPVARAEVYAGSEVETYLRNLQVLGEVPLYPWSARRFTAAEVDRLLPRDTNHPWANRFDWRQARRGRVSVAPVRPEVALRVNTAFPYGYNDGMVWAGRGGTVSGQVGVVARYGPLAVAVMPEGFWAQNARFPLQPNGRTGALRFADAYSSMIDHPQRFGDGAYKRAGWGQSVLEVSGLGLVAGVSSANDTWGPAAAFPVIVGNNAGGFPHVFVGSAAPLDLGLARVHVRSLFGKLTQSAYTALRGDTATRAAAGGIVVVVPRWPRGLELGVGRFIQSVWAGRRSVSTELLSPFSVGARDRGVANDTIRNNLASVFFRWVMPRAGIEVYGELGTEDYRYDLREILTEPDASAGYTVGVRRVVAGRSGALRVVRAEIQNLQNGSLVQSRGQGVFYQHGWLQQGHTVDGQFLGSEFGFGGAAATVAVDWYVPAGRWTVAWSRLLRFDGGTATASSRYVDVLQTLGVEGVFFRGRFDLVAGVTGVYEFNRDLRRDAFNVNTSVAIRTAVP